MIFFRVPEIKPTFFLSVYAWHGCPCVRLSVSVYCSCLWQRRRSRSDVPQNMRQKHATYNRGGDFFYNKEQGCRGDRHHRPLQHVAFAPLSRYIVSTGSASISRQIQHKHTRPPKNKTRKVQGKTPKSRQKWYGTALHVCNIKFEKPNNPKHEKDGRRHRHRQTERGGGATPRIPRCRRLRSFRHEINLSSNSHENENEPEPGKCNSSSSTGSHQPPAKERQKRGEPHQSHDPKTK